MKAVAYYRMSSDRQETSIADQRIAVTAYAQEHGYKIIREYADEGISGWKSGEQREAFRQLIEDASAKHDFEAVLCWDQDRFSRFPVLEANHYWYLLDVSGVHIATVAQGRLNFADLGEWLKASVTQHGKAEYVRDLARNTTRGLRAHKLAGRWVGKAPIGYRLSEGKLEPGDPRDIETVQTIFRMRANGYGLVAIAGHLNKQNAPTPRGAPWSNQAIRHILQRDAYIGQVVIGKHSRAKFFRLTDGVVVLENQHPAIIDRETWDKAQAMNCPKHKKRHSRGSAALSGLITCGRCGGPMYSSCDSRWNRFIYICANHNSNGTCGRCYVHQDEIHAAVAKQIRDSVLGGSRDALEAIIAKRLAAVVPKRDPKPQLERELTRLNKRIQNAVERLVSVEASLVPEVERKLLEMKAERQSLTEKIEATEAVQPKATPKQIADRLWRLPEVLKAAPAAESRKALSQIVKRITLEFQEKPDPRLKYKAFEVTGGTVELQTCSDDAQPLGLICILGTSKPLRLSAKDFTTRRTG